LRSEAFARRRSPCAPRANSDSIRRRARYGEMLALPWVRHSEGWW
jgi:hypothetical protein